MTGREPARYLNQQFGKYTLLERIGIGGMAEIFRGKQYGAHGFQKEVAIKRILPNLTDDQEFVEMFIDEAKIMVGLVHANLVQVFDLGEIESAYFIGMEYVYGKDLLDLLARCAEMQLKIPLKLGIFIVMELCKGLDYAHRAKDDLGDAIGIIHRDVSPSNVLLSYQGEVKVGDFGVAKAATQRTRTEVGTLKGKVGYMSPEQVRGDDIDHRSDLFAAGIILYEILNMRRLFIGGSDLDVMLRVRDVDIDAELQASVALPPELERIVRKALAGERGERYQWANELHDDLLDFLYQNRLRVTGMDLANFMQRIFKKEIEQDKARRRQLREQEEALAKESKESEEVPWASGPRASSSPRSKPAPRAPKNTSPRPPSIEANISYRYRDKSGLVFGPMSEKTLTNLLAGSPLHADDRISCNGSDWLELKEVSNVYGAIIRSKKSASPSKNPKISKVAPSVLPPSGGLEKWAFPRLLYRVWSHQLTGRLEVSCPSQKKVIYFKAGEPTVVESSNDAELLGNFLVRERILSKSQLEHALTRAQAFGGRLGDALVADRIIQSHVLFEYLFKQAKLKLFDVFTWRSGEFSYSEGIEPKQQSYPLGIDTLEVILEGVKRYVERHVLSAAFVGREYLPLEPVKSPKLPLDSLRLTARELRIASVVLRGPTSLDTLDRILTGSAKIKVEDIQRVVYLLLQLELIESKVS